jgi:hypothetical protein
MRCAGQLGSMKGRRGSYMVLVGKPERRRDLKNQGVDGKILKRIFDK